MNSPLGFPRAWLNSLGGPGTGRV